MRKMREQATFIYYMRAIFYFHNIMQNVSFKMNNIKCLFLIVVYDRIKIRKYFILVILQIIMNREHIASENFFISPILQSQEDKSPYLSPFLNHFRKLSEGFEDLIDFRLEDPLQPAHQIDPFPSQNPNEDLAFEKEYKNQLLFQGSLGYQESAQLNNSHHCQIPSTKFVQIKEESQPPFFQLKPSIEGSSAQAMIEFFIEHSNLKESSLETESLYFSQGNSAIQRAFQILASKFKKLRKTKEQMIKYCMRKAFKFIAEYTKSDLSRAKDLDDCMREYFQDVQEGNFVIPFKKHSTQKTMNGNFLKRIFSCQQFCQDYKIFLGHFQSLVIQDNQKKIKYLASLVQEAIQKNDAESINKIKRLPWTREILQKVFDLGVSLSQRSHQTSRNRSLND